MPDVLYSLIIFPLVQLIDLFYLFVCRVFDDYGIALIGVSVLVSLCTLPLYFIAERWQQIERDIQKKLKPGIDKIRAVFKGDEHYLILSTYYRQNQYHPIYALRGSIGLLIQIPFFIAAYSYLSHLEILRYASFLFVSDLSKSDALLRLGGVSVNMLPILMTLINCAAGAIYTKGFPLKDKLQLYGMAAVFLALLYNSPAGLVLYWTMNNVFSLVKNILQKTKHAGRIIYGGVCLCVLVLDVFLIFFHDGYIVKRIFVCILASVVFFAPLFIKAGGWAAQKIGSLCGERPAAWYNRIFGFSIASLFLLAGFVIPGSLIASSAQEFSFIESYKSPFPFLFYTALQAGGIFLFWPLCIYFLFSQRIKIRLTFFMAILLVIALADTFAFSGDYGFITNTLILSNPGTFLSDFSLVLFNILALVAAAVLFTFFLLRSKSKVVYSFFSILCIALLSFSVLSGAKIGKDFSQVSGTQNPHSDILEPVYHLTKTGKNVLLIMLDRGISSFVPYMFAERGELAGSFSGFTWYPDCVSFGRFTIFGAPALFGGYEYTPTEIQARDTETLVQKYNEALLVLPKLFLDNGFSVTVTDPSWANFSWKPDLRIYNPWPAIHAENIIGKYTSYWLQNHPDVQLLSVADILKNHLIRFSFFKMAPMICRTFIFDRGKWLSASALADDEIQGQGTLTVSTMNEYAMLDFLPEITALNDDSANTFTCMISQLTHEPVFFQFPDYIPRTPVTDKGSGPLAEEIHYHADMAAFLLLGKWFDFLKANQVYDNTRILIVSDHGWDLRSGIPGNITLPDGRSLQTYNALLMMKDFDSQGDLHTDTQFMTNAEAPILAVNKLIPNPVNPFTLKALERTKNDEGAAITSSGNLHPTAHGKFTYNTQDGQWLHVHDNIFDPENWEKVEK